MEKIYIKIWEKAKPFYQKGRPYDIPHIKWMMEQAERITEIEGLNKMLLIPIAILHDVGYCKVNKKNPNTKSKEFKRIHMIEGAKIAEKILKEVNFDPEIAKKVVYYISVHDNWIFDDNKPFQECKEMAVFNDLDFIYAVSSYDIVKTQAEAMKKKPEEMYEFWANDEKLVRRPFCCEETKKLFDQLMDKLKKSTEVF